MTLQQLINLLRNEDEVLVLEMLDIKTDELIDMFMSKVEERLEYIRKQYE
jgi:hypothetical protein